MKGYNSMGLKKIYKLINNELDCYDCDYTGNAEDLVSPLNKLFTKTFLTEELLSRVNEELNGKPYQKFHLILSFDVVKGKPINNMYIGIEYDNNLVATSTEYGDFMTTHTIIRTVNEHLKDLGYPLDNWNVDYFLDALIEKHPEFAKYFNVEIIK